MKSITPHTKRRVSFYIGLGAALGLGAAFAFAEARSHGWAALSAHLVARGAGWCAAGALLLSLAVTPTQLILARSRSGRAPALPPMRRGFGIAAAVLATVHAGLALAGPLDGAWGAITTWPHLRAGLVALLILLVLLVTSFPQTIRTLRVRVWKPLHRLSYAAAALVVLHLFLGPFVSRRAVAVVALLFLLSFLLRLSRFLRSSRFSSGPKRSTPPS